jgi:hypothetical protein
MIHAFDLLKLYKKVPRAVILEIRSFMWNTRYADWNHVSYSMYAAERCGTEWHPLRDRALCACDRSSGARVDDVVTAVITEVQDVIEEAVDRELAEEIPLGGDVIENIVHHDPAAEIPPAEAQSIVHIQEADFVQRNAQSAWVPEPQDGLILMQMNRITKSLEEAFLHGPALQSIRAEMEEEQCTTILSSGAWIFVRPCHYLQAAQAAARTIAPQTLKTSHVIFEQRVEHLLAEAINSVPESVWAKGQAYVRDGNFISEVSEETIANATSASDGLLQGPGAFIFKNTFLCWVLDVGPSAHSGAHTV